MACCHVCEKNWLQKEMSGKSRHLDYLCLGPEVNKVLSYNLCHNLELWNKEILEMTQVSFDNRYIMGTIKDFEKSKILSLECHLV